MDRRELLKHGAAAACVAAVPGLLNLPLLSQNTELPRIAWPENSQTLAHRNAMIPLLKRFKENQNVTTLSADEWDALANHHQYYHGMHGEVGHLGAIDTIVKNNEAYLKTKYNPAHIDSIIKYGSYAIVMRDAGRFHEVAEKLRLKRYGQLDEQGHLENAQYYIDMSCESFFSIAAIWMGILSIVVGPEVGLIFALLAILNDAFGVLGCNSGWI